LQFYPCHYHRVSWRQEGQLPIKNYIVLKQKIILLRNNKLYCFKTVSFVKLSYLYQQGYETSDAEDDDDDRDYEFHDDDLFYCAEVVFCSIIEYHSIGHALPVWINHVNTIYLTPLIMSFDTINNVYI